MRDRSGAVVSCVLVAALGAAAGWSFTVAFRAADLAWPVLGAAVGAAAVAVALELTGRRSLATAVAASAVGWLTFVLVGLLPGAEDGPLVGLGVAVTDGWARIASSTVPAPASPELLVVPATATWVAVALGCELARRTRSSLLPALPAVVLLAVGLVFGADRSGPGLAVVGVVVALAAGLAAVRTWQDDVSGDDGLPVVATSEGRQARLVAAVPVVVVVALLAGVVGPRLPLINGRTAYDVRDAVREPLRRPAAASPFDRLAAGYLDDPETEGDDRDEALFVVRADGPLPTWPDADPDPDGGTVDLVRIPAAVFDRYDGSSWDVSGVFRTTGDELPPPPSVGDGAERTTVSVEVAGLDGPWLPTIGRAEAIRFADGGGPVQVDEVTGSLLLPSGLAPGDAYELDVVLGRLDDGTAPAPGTPPDDGASVQVVVADADLTNQLARIATVADEVVGADRASYPDLLADLEALFHGTLAERRGPLTGELAAWEPFEFLGPEALAEPGEDGRAPAAPTGHSLARVLELLYTPLPGADEPSRRAGRGTPEQFATAYVVLARSVGVPARVAVGWSVPVPTGEAPREVEVRARHADAWPEVWSEGTGWVPVDVTPVDVGALPDEPDMTTTSTATPPTTDAAEVPAPVTATSVLEPAGDPGQAGPVGLLIRLVLVLVVLALVVLGVPALVRLRRRSVRRAAPTAARRISGAWEQVLDVLVAYGVDVRAWMTVDEVVAAVRDRLGPLPADTTAEVGAELERSVCGAPDPGDRAAEAAWTAADRLARQVRRRVPPAQRMRAAVDLRPAVRRARQARHDRQALARPTTAPVPPPDGDDPVPPLVDTAPPAPPATDRLPAGVGAD